MAPAADRRRRLWPFVLLLAGLVLSAASGAASDADQPAQQPGTDEGAAVSPAPMWRGLSPFSSAVNVGWVLAAALECIGFGAYHIWGGAAAQEQQQQQQQQLQPLAGQDGGGGLVPQWLKALWAQHWADVQQHLPAPWGHVVAQWHAHGAAAGYVLAGLAATAAAGMSWIVFLERRRVMAMHGCWDHMLAAVRADREGAPAGSPWWATYRGARAFWRAASTGPCAGVPVPAPGFWAGLVGSAVRRLASGIGGLAGGRGAHVEAWVQDRAQWALFWVDWTTDTIVDAALALYKHAMARTADAVARIKAMAGWAFGWLAAIEMAITAGVLVLLLAWVLWCWRDYLMEEFEVGLPGMGSQEGAGPVPSRDDETRSESVDIKAPPAVPQPPAEPPPEETEEDKAAEAFGRMQRFAHRLTSTLAKAGVALRAREAVAAYDACHCLLESIHRLERRDDLQWEQVQKPWLETLWGWFDFIFATLQDWVEHGGVHHPALELLEGDARTNARSRVIRTYARLARTGEERWLSPRPASYPTQQPSQQQQQQQHWEETWALHALAGRVRRRYFAECGLTQRRALSVALARMLRQPLPMPDAPSRLLYRTQVLRLSADPRGEGDAEDGPVLQPHGSPRAILLRACFLPSSSSSTPKCRAGCLAPSPRASLVMPYLGAADREAIAAAVLGPVRQREKRLLASSFSGLVALSREEVVGLAKVLASLGDGDVEALQAMLAAGGTEAKPEPGPAEEESTAASLSQGGEEEAQLQKEVEPLALVPSYALEVIVELRGPAPPRESWCMFEGRRMVAARLRKHKEPATATAAGSAGNPSTASCTPVTAKRASAGAPRIKDEQHAAEEGEAPPFFPAQQPPLSPREDPHVTWADPLVEMEMAAAPSPQGSSRSSSTTSTTSSGDPPAVVSRRYRPSRRALVVGLAAMLVVGLIAVLVAVLWKERPPARPIKQEAIAESEVKGGGRRLPTPAPVESREPLTYAEWQELARGRWGDVGYPRVGKAGQTVAQLVEGAASARDWILYEAMGAFDPAWRPGRHFRMSPEFRQYHDQWAAAVGAGRVKGWK